MQHPSPGSTKARRGIGAKLGLALLVLAGAVAVAATRVSFLQGSAPSQGRAADAAPAPEFAGIAGWINSDPLTIARLRGSVTMLDFWTYSCINCVRTIPGNRRLYERYEPFGLRIVGVHSPEFGFEKVASNVRAAVQRLGVPWPVALDSDMATWRAYRNAYWPRVYLIDAQGRIRFDYAGEGHESQIERNVRTLLAEAGRAGLPAPLDANERDVNPHITPEVYAGYQRNSGQLLNREGYEPSAVVRYLPPTPGEVEAAGSSGSFFVAGAWRNEPEYLEATEDGARVILPFYAQDVFFVAAPADGDTSVRVLLDGAPVASSVRPDGATVAIERSDLFTAVRLSRPERHVLTIEADAGFRLFTFTFG